MPNSTLNVFVSQNVDDSRMAELAALSPRLKLQRYDSAEELEARIGEADIIGGPVSRAAFVRATRLKWLHSWAAGPNEQLFDEVAASPVPFTCSKGNGAIPLAEHAIMLMLMLNRNMMRWVDAQRERRWDSFVHEELNGKTVGIIGMGHSGSDLALKCQAFHMRVVGLRRTPAPSMNFSQVYGRHELSILLAESDFVVMTAPITPETENMLGETEFRLMKPTAFYICFSRGGVANDAALEKALREGWIAGAGLDAHGVEPLPPESPFWTLPNTIVTPHNGATTKATHRRGFEIFRDNLRRYLAGEPLLNLVDKTAGY